MTRTTARPLLGAVLLVAVLGGCGTTAPPEAPATAEAPASSASAAPPSTPAEEPGSGATAFLLETPEFSVGLPREPVMAEQPVPDVPGAVAVTYTVDDGATAVALAVADYPADLPLADPTTLLEGVRDGSVGALPGGAVTSSEPVTVDGRPGLDLVATVTGGTYLARIVLDDRRVYQVITAGSEDRAAEHDEIAASLTIA